MTWVLFIVLVAILQKATTIRILYKQYEPKKWETKKTIYRDINMFLILMMVVEFFIGLVSFYHASQSELEKKLATQNLITGFAGIYYLNYFTDSYRPTHCDGMP